ncbi:ComF family protein [Polynucleobacter sp. Latsch14-2]|jgi:ComF family protein|uniref:ComF family protein n=1 Tax=Polynucleobacter sp. Latsch14-2 TaxID=2576920 RepID=UPI001C0D0B23|nr:phosphoribosyltransferase family protein [Polynucleobacter sp. Latsch14-2]MBU3613434.1 ComF family protein [Polynucleobacter sp. Latsch14-2]
MLSLTSTIKSLFTKTIAVALPTSCIICETFQEHVLCNTCTSIFAHQGLLNYECCTQCGITLERSEVCHQHCYQCELDPPNYDETYCLDRYDGALQTALHQLKYQKRLAFAAALASAWNQFLADSLKHTDASYLLPVPLSEEKLCIRGFNQSWEIARRIQCWPHIQKLPNVLRRHHHGQTQALGSRAMRTSAIAGVFYIEEKYLHALENKTIVIFDDVMTSGSTLNEVARVLKDNGVSRVINWVLLRTPRSIQPRAQHV